MTSRSDLARQYNAAQLAHAEETARAVVATWSGVQLADLDGTFGALAARIVALLLRGQLLGAVTATAYHNALLAQAGLAPTGPTLNPAGYTEPQRLSAAVAFAPVRVKQRIGAGLEPARAMAAGRAELAMIASTETQESARGAMDVALNTESQYRGYLRQPDGGACADCLILAGRFYRSNDGFDRHPHCHCTHEPVLQGSDFSEPPKAKELFGGLPEAEQDRRFGKVNADAIRAGADPAQVVNAKRGMRKAGDGFTTEGTKRRKNQRLSPYGVRKQAGGDRERYVDLLRSNGYVF